MNSIARLWARPSEHQEGIGRLRTDGNGGLTAVATPELLFGEDKPPTEALGPLVRECAAVEDSLQRFLEFLYSPRGVADRDGPGGLLCEIEPDTQRVKHVRKWGGLFLLWTESPSQHAEERLHHY